MLDSRLQVWDLIGRALALRRGGAGMGVPGGAGEEQPPLLAAGVIARSAAVGGNEEKRVCACDGTVIWDASGRVTAVKRPQAAGM